MASSCIRRGLFNVLLTSSTWLTVVMAVGRYVAVCRPLHARGFISVRGTRIAIASVFIGSIVFNLPRFWHYQMISMPRDDINAVQRSATARLPPADRRRLPVLSLLHQRRRTALSQLGVRHRLRRRLLGGRHTVSASGSDGVQRVPGAGAAPVAPTAEAVPRHEHAMSVHQVLQRQRDTEQSWRCRW